ncbi:hypothetical protein CBR_g50007 [Chara braunii]|uniref:pectinesterase n=1 Tax=Chara braunii TaxID=69332 RepID=A0A388K5C4_CHABU|nr:hypothetical protein CBR_g50007 [Chara braunii]|eukprot:GBG65216.1 hypothetical protein CBR_g50007 [Chara braunii]
MLQKMLTNLRKSELSAIHMEMAEIIANASRVPVNEHDLMRALDELRQRATYVTLPALRETVNRNKISWLIRGDRMNAAFFRQRTRKTSPSLMFSMRHPWDAEQPVAKDTAAILQNVALFYEHLLASQAQHTEQELLHDFADTVWAALGPKLSPPAAQKLDRKIEMEEVHLALTALPPHKVPGQDGLPLLFFTKHQMRLLPELTVVLQSVFEGGVPPVEMVTGIVTFIYKKGDRADVRNWRPITLMPVLYKVLSKILAQRLQPVLPSLIHASQTGFLKDRQILFNIMTVEQIMELVSAGESSTAILLIDLEKAYDRVGWEFLQAAMTVFGFGERFRHAVCALHTGAVSRLTINGKLSPPIHLGRSVRQGCPMAPYLYLIYVAVMHAMIRANPQVPGFPLPSGDFIKTESFADDSVAFLPVQDEAFQELKNTISLFCHVSQARVNWEKSSLFIPPQAVPPQNWGLRVVTPAQHDRLLGHRISFVPDLMTDASTAVETVKKALAPWVRQKGVSLFGRSLVLNNAVFSTIWYQRALRQLDAPAQRAIKTLAGHYLWKEDISSTTFLPKVAWEVVTQPKRSGGLAILDPACQVTALLSRWVPWAILQGPFVPWRQFAEFTLCTAWDWTDLRCLWIAIQNPAYLGKHLPQGIWQDTFVVLRLPGLRGNTAMATVSGGRLLLLLFAFTAVCAIASGGSVHHLRGDEDGGGRRSLQGGTEINVCKSPTCRYSSVQAALDSLPKKRSERWTIRIGDGTYREKVIFKKQYSNLNVIGNTMDPSKVVIIKNDRAGTVGPSGEKLRTIGSATVGISASNILFQGISFVNDAPRPTPGTTDGQAVALRAGGFNLQFYNCRFQGFQDTLYAHKGLHFFKNCYIEGTVDFIFGYGLTQFEDCYINNLPNAFTVTAQSRKARSENNGFLFLRGTVAGSGGALLGRAWGAFSTVWFVQTNLQASIDPKGWDDFRDPARQATVDYAEYGCTGAGADRSRRVTYSRALSAADVQPYLDGSRKWINGGSWVQVPNPLPGVPTS